MKAAVFCKKKQKRFFWEVGGGVWGFFLREREMRSDRGLGWVFGGGDDSCQINGFTWK